MRLINKKELFLLEEVVKRNFSAKYKDSVLGILWTILQPLLIMILFTIIFSTIFSRNIKNFQVYFLCGWCVYMLFTNSISNTMYALKGNKNILLRTPAPKYIFVIGSIISEFLNFIIMLILLIIIMIATHTPFHLSIIFSFIPIISVVIMVTGLGLMLSIVCVYYSDIKHLWSVLSLMIMYASAIFYPMDIIPNEYKQYIILNPIFWAIDQFRCFVYLNVFPSVGYMVNLMLISLIILVFGVIIFKKYEDRITMKF